MKILWNLEKDLTIAHQIILSARDNYECIEALKLHLIQHPEDLHKRTYYKKFTPIMLAALHVQNQGCYECLKFLANHPHTTSDEAQEAFECIVLYLDSPFNESFQYLISKLDLTKTLELMVKNHYDVRMIKRYLNYVSDTTISTEHWKEIIHVAYQYANIEFIKCILNRSSQNLTTAIRLLDETLIKPSRLSLVHDQLNILQLLRHAGTHTRGWHFSCDAIIHDGPIKNEMIFYHTWTKWDMIPNAPDFVFAYIANELKLDWISLIQTWLKKLKDNYTYRCTLNKLLERVEDK